MVSGVAVCWWVVTVVTAVRLGRGGCCVPGRDHCCQAWCCGGGGCWCCCLGHGGCCPSCLVLLGHATVAAVLLGRGCCLGHGGCCLAWCCSVSVVRWWLVTVRHGAAAPSHAWCDHHATTSASEHCDAPCRRSVAYALDRGTVVEQQQQQQRQEWGPGSCGAGDSIQLRARHRVTW